MLNLPEFEFKITKDEAEKLRIFDPLRAQHLVLTPEEWVRQNLIRYLIVYKGYKKGLISSERGLNVHAKQQRYDVVCYTNELKPYLLVECKAPSVPLDEAATNQIMLYNTEIKAPYLLLSNGMVHRPIQLQESGKYVLLDDIPEYQE